MPAFDMTIQDKTYHVEIPDPGANPLRVIVDGEPFEVGVVGTEAGAEVGSGLPPPPRPATQPAALPHTAQRAAPHPTPPITPTNGGSHDIFAPMPGTLLSMEVKIGQQIEPGDVLCVLEAMKMKNPIRATHAGSVAEICVETGNTVPHGAVLIRLA